MKTPLFAVLLAVAAASPVFAQSDEGEYWANKVLNESGQAMKEYKEAQAAKEAAAAAAAKAAEAPKGACAENRELDTKGWEFQLKGVEPISMSFFYPSCKLEGTAAVRLYWADQAGYGLIVRTEAGAKTSTLTIIEDWAGRPRKVAADLGSKPNASLLKGTLDLGAIKVTDTRTPETKTHSGKASMKAGEFGRPSNEPLRGCQ